MQNVKRIVRASKVYDRGYTGYGIRIALLDTGAFLHNDLKNRIVWFKDYIKGRTISYDDNGHGTHIAGILCGQQKNGYRHMGMCVGAELVVFKVLDEKGNGKTEYAIDALEWIQKNHLQYNIRILNFSMGYLPSANKHLQQTLLKKLEELWDEGVVVVTAAGNNGPNENSITVPGISRKVITVGAINDVNSSSSYSGNGPTSCCIVKPEILAPGDDILSLSNQGGYVKKTGTSMATPIVSGALALALEKKKSLTPVELKLLLYDSVQRFSKKRINSPAWGILDVDKLMEML